MLEDSTEFNASAIFALNENTLKFFNKIGFNLTPPEGVSHIAFKESGEVIYLHDLPIPFRDRRPFMKLNTLVSYDDITIFID